MASPSPSHHLTTTTPSKYRRIFLVTFAIFCTFVIASWKNNGFLLPSTEPSISSDEEGVVWGFDAMASHMNKKEQEGEEEEEPKQQQQQQQQTRKEKKNRLEELSKSKLIRHPHKYPKVEAIHFLGERHSGTNWIYGVLKDCFGESIKVERKMSRFKHWFQYNDPNRTHANSLLITIFRNPYSWTNALRLYAYNAPHHKNLDWHTFVTRPWTMDRFGCDVPRPSDPICTERFEYDQVSPCCKHNFYEVKPHPRYELYQDGSGGVYQSVVDMRRDKILNFAEETLEFENLLDTWTVRFEDLTEFGTEVLIENLEKVTGLERGCDQQKEKEEVRLRKRRLKESNPLNMTEEERTEWINRHKSRDELDAGFIEWMNDHVDWDVEAKIGYHKNVFFY